MKITTLMQFAKDENNKALRPAPTNLGFYRPILDFILQQFGEDRIIYGSNWPVTDRGGEYGEQLAIIRAHFAPKGKRVTDKLFWKNAAKFYGVK